MKKHLLLLFTLLLSFSMLMAQNTKKGDKAFENGDYYQAIEEYSLLVDNMPDAATRSLLRYRIAESYRRMNRPEKAEKHYVDAIKAGYMSPEVYFGYGDILLKLGKYDEAKTAFETYKRSSPGDRLVDAKIASCSYAKENQVANPNFTMQPLESLNSRGSEFGIAYFNDALIYASTGNPVEDGDSKEMKKISLRTGLPYSRMYMSVPMNGVYAKGEEVVGLNKISNTNEGSFTYDMRTKLGYFTRCEVGDNQCYIYFAEFKGNKWVEKNRLPIDGRKQPIAHPCFTPDGNRLYFVSAMEGGYGMSDIWYIDRLPDDKWSKAINVGREVNSVGNEFFPFVMNGYLFFASEGHPGYGGLDLFASKIDGNAHGPAYNLGMPFNTNQDDFNLIAKLDLSEGMMVSTRRGEKSDDDIFRFNGFPHSIIASGRVYDSISGEPLPEATVEVIRGGKVEETLSLSDSGAYMFFVLPDTVYELKASLLTYTTKTISFKTTEERFGRLDNMDIPLNSTEAFISGLVYDEATNAPLSGIPVLLFENGKRISVQSTDATGHYRFADINPNTHYLVRATHKEYYPSIKELAVATIPRSIDFNKSTGSDMDLPLKKIPVNVEIPIENILYDLNKANLRPESLIELDKLVEILNTSPQMKLQINSHTDARGSVKSNNTLSEKRAKSVVDYLVSRGINPERLTWKGWGKSNLLVNKPRMTEPEHQLNRRTTFTVVGLMDVPLFDTSTTGSATISVPAGTTGGVATTTSPSTTTTTTATPLMPSSGAFSNPNGAFRIQVGAGVTLNLNNPNYQRLTTQLNLQVFYEYDGRTYRYFVGGYNTRAEAEAMLPRVRAVAAGLSDAFVRPK